MWTWLAYLTLFLCLLIIVVEFIWLYILSARSEDKTIKHRQSEKIITRLIETIVHSPTEYSQKNEVQELKEYVLNDRVRMDILSLKMMDLIIDGDEKTRDLNHKAFYSLYSSIDPTEYYSSLLRNGNLYEKAFACRKLSDYYAQEEIETIRKLAFSKNKDLAYNASITLSILGDQEGVLQVISGYADNYEISHRIILEMLEKYSGDLKKLSTILLEDSDEYICAAIVKALAKFEYESFELTYLKYLREGSINLKIAALRALGALGKVQYERDIIVASTHKNWAVRSAAVKAMRKIPTDKIKMTLANSTKDPEWWVRYNAAKTLVAIDTEYAYIEKILQGYDRFASEAVKHALYQISYGHKDERVS